MSHAAWSPVTFFCKRFPLAPGRNAGEVVREMGRVATVTGSGYSLTFASLDSSFLQNISLAVWDYGP